VQHLTNEAIAFRAAADGGEITVLLNVGDDPVRFPVDVSVAAVAEGPDADARPGDPALVPPHGWVILGT
jgi:cyclomaltodextrinase / maltogenic alpha-amylase / neopullulanase